MNKELFKTGRYSKIILIVVMVALVPIILLVLGNLKAIETMKNENMELEVKLSDSDASLTKLRGEYASVFADYKDIIVEYDKMNEDVDYNEYIANKNDVELALSEKETYLESIEAEIPTVQATLDTLNEEIIKVKTEPISLPAGYLYAGKDFPIGRYRIFDGSSNFNVFDISDYLVVNVILGSGSNEVEEYLYVFRVGDYVKSKSSFKMEPIE